MDRFSIYKLSNNLHEEGIVGVVIREEAKQFFIIILVQLVNFVRLFIVSVCRAKMRGIHILFVLPPPMDVYKQWLILPLYWCQAEKKKKRKKIYQTSDTGG